jgi:hypothetical protein
MNLFVSYAERASSEDLQDVLARILAGEIRRPGSFSLRTMQFMSVLDHDLAKSVELAVSCTIGSRYVPMNGPLKKALLRPAFESQRGRVSHARIRRVFRGLKGRRRIAYWCEPSIDRLGRKKIGNPAAAALEMRGADAARP